MPFELMADSKLRNRSICTVCVACFSFAIAVRAQDQVAAESCTHRIKEDDLRRILKLEGFGDIDSDWQLHVSCEEAAATVRLQHGERMVSQAIRDSSRSVERLTRLVALVAVELKSTLQEDGNSPPENEPKEIAPESVTPSNSKERGSPNQSKKTRSRKTKRSPTQALKENPLKENHRQDGKVFQHSLGLSGLVWGVDTTEHVLGGGSLSYRIAPLSWLYAQASLETAGGNQEHNLGDIGVWTVGGSLSLGAQWRIPRIERLVLFGSVGARAGGVRFSGRSTQENVRSADVWGAWLGPLAGLGVSTKLTHSWSLVLDADAGWFLHEAIATVDQVDTVSLANLWIRGSLGIFFQFP